VDWELRGIRSPTSQKPLINELYLPRLSPQSSPSPYVQELQIKKLQENAEAMARQIDDLQKKQVAMSRQIADLKKEVDAKI
jgi:hypothetical protein